MVSRVLGRVVFYTIFSLILINLTTTPVLAGKYENSNVAYKKGNDKISKEIKEVKNENLINNNKYKNSNIAKKSKIKNENLKNNNLEYLENNAYKEIDNVTVKNKLLSNDTSYKKDKKNKINNEENVYNGVGKLSDFNKDNLDTNLVLSQIARDRMIYNINNSRLLNNFSMYNNTPGLNMVSDLHILEMKSVGLKHTETEVLKNRVLNNEGNWSSIGENVGVARYVKLDEESIKKAVDIIHNVMMKEIAPNDGHKRNILSKFFTKFGVAVGIVNINDGYADVYVSETYAK